MTPQDVISSGTTLHAAYNKYARADKLNSSPNKLPAPDQIKNSPEAVALHHTLSEFSDGLRKWGDANSSKHNNFIKQLSLGNLIGAGYLSPRNISDQPKIIPADIWQLGKINYAKSAIEYGSLLFESVRIIKMSKNAGIKPNIRSHDNYRPSNKPPRPAGRPASRNNIIATYEELKSECAIDYSKPMTHAYPIIQARLFEKHNTEIGFGNEAIRLVIRDDFQLAAGKQKSAQKL